MILEYINWSVNPEIFKLFGTLSIRYYGLMFALSFFLSYKIMFKFFKYDKLSVELLDKLTMYVAIATIAGARIGHCLFYQPDYFLPRPLEIILPFKGIPFTENFEFTGYQGLASHGAGIGILIGLYLFCKKYNKKMLWVLDRIGIVAALSGFFIRMGNLFNSEIYGVETNLPWGFVYLNNGEEVPKHPTQIYEALTYLIIFYFLYRYFTKHKGKVKEGLVFSLFLISVFTARFLIEFVKNDQVGFEGSMVINMGQWLSLPFIITGIYIYSKSRKKPVPK